MLSFAESPTRFLFFTGKGGVGKTSLAAATALALTDAGRRVLLVSTDPASNIGQVFGMGVATHADAATAVPGGSGLFALNIDPEAAAADYRERVVGPMRGLLPDDAVAGMTEQLSGACTTEIASFDRFTLLLTDAALAEDYDHIVFDTAPTGHTLRLLSLPAAWADFIDHNPAGASCLGPSSGLKAQRAQYAAAVKALSDPARTTLVLVTRPERSALAEAARACGELLALGIRSQRLVVNGRFVPTQRSDALALAIERRQAEALNGMPEALQGLPTETVALQDHDLVGLGALRALLAGPSADAALPATEATEAALYPPLVDLVDEIEQGGRGLVMTLGKGGVGKTTIAAAVALELAARGHTVHLTTTDPAAHVSEAVGSGLPGLTVSRIDPAEERRRYTEHVLAAKGHALDAAGRRLLEEDLQSPCTEEVAVFHAFSKVVREAARGFVVVDTAPTGHTLLLLDATGSYHREVLRTSALAPGRVTTPLMRLQDPDYTRLVIVTLPETTPVAEAAGLQEDLRRAGIEPFAWVVNQSLSAAGPTDPVLARRADAERAQIDAVAGEHARKLYVASFVAEPPVGAARLRSLARGAAAHEPAAADA